MSDSDKADLQADQLLVDAMLRGSVRDTTESLQDRMHRVQRAISAEAQQSQLQLASTSETKPIRNWNNIYRAALGGVTALAAVLMVAVLLQTSPVSATDLLQRAHTVESNAAVGEQRYQVTIRPPHQHGSLPVVSGILDVRDGRQMRFDLTHPNGTHHIWGFGPEGPWQITPSGKVIRDRGPRWPRWLMGESRSLLIDTMPGLLDLVLTGYDAESTTADDGMTRIVATQRDAAEGGPDEIVIELDPEENQVHALELRWSPGSEERWQRSHHGQRRAKDASGDATDRGPHPSRESARRGESNATDGPPGRGRGFAQRHRPPGHPGQGGRRGAPAHQQLMDEDAAADTKANPHQRRRDAMREMKDRFRRPGGPPAPRSIRFERIPTQTLPDDWYAGPSAQDSDVDSR